MESGSTRLAAVIGSPVGHSLSPAIHNAAFRALDLDWTYLAFDVARGQGAAALDAMRTLHLGGLSVTMPHKAEVAQAVDRLTSRAAELGAANCVAWDSGELVGHNTDGDGFIDSLSHDGVDVAGAACYVVGAGGAARAVITALVSAGAAQVVVVNRSPAGAASAASLGGSTARVGRPAEVKDADIVVNATPVGMAGTPAATSIPIDAALLHSGQLVVDLVYHPVRTPLLRAAESAGAATATGVGMLVHQAALQFQLWTGQAAPIEVMAAAAHEAIEG